MRKSFIISAAAALIALVGCNKQDIAVNEIPAGGGNLIVSLGDGFASTKATGVTAAQEKNIAKAIIIVFDADGNVEQIKDDVTQSVVSMTVTAGNKYVWALVNGSDNIRNKVKAIKSKDEFKAIVSNYVADNPAVNNLVMFGTVNDKDDVVAVSESVTANAEVKVRRLVARVSIEKITNNITSSTDAVYANAAMRIKAIYMINCAGDCGIGGAAPTVANFVNKRKNNGDNAALLADNNINKSLSTGSSYSTEHSFYCYPNPTSTDTSAETWSARFTRLDVEVGFTRPGLSEETFYYPLSIKGGIERNKSYIITSLTITRRGSDDPDVPVDDLDSFTVTIKVIDWETGASYTYNI